MVGDCFTRHNYIASPWLGEVKRQDYQRDLVLMQQANINAVRVHAHIAGQDFMSLLMNWVC